MRWCCGASSRRRPSSRWARSSASTREEAALGIVRVANAEMVRALRVISVERGLDPREFALLAFGGAGGMHACSLAEELGMRDRPRPPRRRRPLRPRPRHLRPPPRLREPLPRGPRRSGRRASSRRGSRRWRTQQRRTSKAPEYTRRADLRYRGQSFELTVEADSLEKLEERFHAAHEQRYGYRMEDEPVELVNLRLDRHRPGREAGARRSQTAKGEAETGAPGGELRRGVAGGAGAGPRRDGRGLRGRGACHSRVQGVHVRCQARLAGRG